MGIRDDKWVELQRDIGVVTKVPLPNWELRDLIAQVPAGSTPALRNAAYTRFRSSVADAGFKSVTNAQMLDSFIWGYAAACVRGRAVEGVVASPQLAEVTTVRSRLRRNLMAWFYRNESALSGCSAGLGITVAAWFAAKWEMPRTAFLYATLGTWIFAFSVSRLKYRSTVTTRSSGISA